MTRKSVLRKKGVVVVKIFNNAFYRIFDFAGLKQNDLMLNADTRLSGVTNFISRTLIPNSSLKNPHPTGWRFFLIIILVNY